MTTTDPLARSLADAPDEELHILAPSDKVAEPPMLKTSIRLPLELLAWAKNEAGERNLNSLSDLLRELLERERRALADDTPVRTTMGEIHRALSQALHRSDAA